MIKEVRAASDSLTQGSVFLLLKHSKSKKIFSYLGYQRTRPSARNTALIYLCVGELWRLKKSGGDTPRRHGSALGNRDLMQWYRLCPLGSTRSQVRILSPRSQLQQGLSRILEGPFSCGWTGVVGRKLDGRPCERGCRACFVFRRGGLGSELLQGVTGSWSAIRPGGSFFGRPWPVSPALCGPKAPRKRASDQRGLPGARKGLYASFYCSVRS